MSIQIDAQTTVRDLVGQHPITRPVFEHYGIDYCCGGGRCLADATRERNVELSELVGALEAALNQAPTDAQKVARDWYSAPLAELIDHIVTVHHGYLRTALPRLRSLVPTVLRAHGAHHGGMLRQVQESFTALDTELSGHLMKEEQILFPGIVTIETRAREGTFGPPAPFGSVRNPIQQMEHEHDAAGNLLTKLREATCDYSLPTDACPTFQAMYEELQRMESDLHEHIHLENNILFPRAIELESSL